MRGPSPVAASGGHPSSRCAGLSCCPAQAPDAQAQQPWLTGPATPRHVESSQTRARTCVPCIDRQILNCCTTREAPAFSSFVYILKSGIAGLFGNFFLFVQGPPYFFFYSMHHFTLPQTVHKSFYFSASSPTLFIFSFF